MGSSALIFRSTEFESAICKLQDKRAMDVSDGELESRLLFVSADWFWWKIECSWIAVGRHRDAKLRAKKNSCDVYIEFRFLFPTTYHYKILFSDARRACGDYRKASSPTNSEAFLFPFFNKTM